MPLVTFLLATCPGRRALYMRHPFMQNTIELVSFCSTKPYHIPIRKPLALQPVMRTRSKVYNAPDADIIITTDDNFELRTYTYHLRSQR